MARNGSVMAEAVSAEQATEKIAARGRSDRRLGHWTTARRFEVRASHGSVVLELRSPRIGGGVIEVDLDIDQSTVKLLVPDGAQVEHDSVRRVGRCSYVDWSGSPAPSGRVIRITGEMRRSDLRINRRGVAIVSAMLTNEYFPDLFRAIRDNHVRSLKDVQDAYREGRWTVIEDPGRVAVDPAKAAR